MSNIIILPIEIWNDILFQLSYQDIMAYRISSLFLKNIYDKTCDTEFWRKRLDIDFICVDNYGNYQIPSHYIFDTITTVKKWFDMYDNIRKAEFWYNIQTINFSNVNNYEDVYPSPYNYAITVEPSIDNWFDVYKRWYYMITNPNITIHYISRIANHYYNTMISIKENLAACYISFTNTRNNNTKILISWFQQTIYPTNPWGILIAIINNKEKIYIGFYKQMV